MIKIAKIFARQILDSNGNPTVEVEVLLEDGSLAQASVPSGVSTGSHEAVELSALKAIDNVNRIIAQALIGAKTADQASIDQKLIDLDGTPDKSQLGANSILGVSMAVCRATAVQQKKPLYEYLGQLCGNQKFQNPVPMILMLEGGKHGNWSTDIQELMVMPDQSRFERFTDVLNGGVRITSTLKKILKAKGYSVGVGLEGAFCPKEITSNSEALQILIQAIQEAGFKPGEDFHLALDFASSEFFEDGLYKLKSEAGKIFTPSEWTQEVISWTKKYPILSLEDVHQEDLWQDWADITQILGANHQIVGDDLTTTNPQRIQQAIDRKAINAVIIKLNQIGTVSETLQAIKMTREAGWTPIISHRSGETNDDFIADLAVGSGALQSKFGALSRGERVAKFNRLLMIEGGISRGIRIGVNRGKI